MAKVTGQLGSEYVELDNAATEQTLKDLVAAVKKMAASQQRSAEGQKKLIEKLYQDLKSNAGAIRKNTQAVDNLAKKQATAAKQQDVLVEAMTTESNTRVNYNKELIRSRSGLNKLGVTTTGLVNGFVSLSDNLASLGSSVSASAQIFSVIPVVGSTLATTFGAITKNAEQLVTSFQKAAEIGVSFGGSVQRMVNDASAAGLTFDQYASVIAKAGPGLAMLGNGSEEGAKQFARLSRELRTTLREDGLANLGFSAETANEALANYVNRMSRAGVLQRMTDEQLTQSSGKYLRNLDALAKLTGESRDALQSQQDALLAEAKFRQFLANIDPDSATNIEAMLAGIPEGELRSGLLTLLTTGTALDEASQRVLAFMPNVSRTAIELGRSLETGGRLTQQGFANFQSQFNTEADILKKTPLGDTLAKFVPDLNSFMVGVQTAGERAKDVQSLFDQQMEALRQTIDTTARTLVDGQQRTAEISNRLASALGSLIDPALDLMFFFLEPLQDVLGTTIESLADFTKSLEGKSFFESLTDSFTGFFKTTLDAMKQDLTENGATSKTAQAGLLAAIAGAATYSILKKKGSGERGPGKKSKTGVGAGVGGFFGGLLGQGIGRIISGILIGTATGLRAFASPKVAMGAGIFAGAIATIGAAIGAASWLTGDGLSKLAEGLDKIQGLNSDSLQSVGVALKELGIGLAHLAGGSLATLGDRVIGGIAEFFGADSPMERLQSTILSFQSISIDKNKIEDNAAGLQSFVSSLEVVSSRAFIDSLNGLRDLNAGNLFSNSPLERLGKLVEQYQQISLNQTSVEKTAEGIRTFIHSITEVGAADLSLGNVLDLPAGIKNLKDANKQLDKYIDNLKKVKNESDKITNKYGRMPGSETTPALQPENTSLNESLVNTLTTKLDQLIAINQSIKDVNDRQLREQRNDNPIFGTS